MTWSDAVLDKLWPHQQDAVEVARDYLKAPVAAGESALITMPTGTGKTGVIAAITTCLPEVRGHRLVLTPWNALVTQMIADLSERFWKRLPDIEAPSLPVKRLPRARDLDELRESEPTIYVATIAAISVAAGSRGDELERLVDGVGCVIVDEGHYEPALNWSQAIRALNRRTILLTATPYRNDRKYFTVESHRYRLTHHNAEKNRYLRIPDIKELDAGLSPAAFVTDLVTTVDAAFPDAKPDDVRIIVRCATDDAVERLVHAIRDAGHPVIGVHERFIPGYDPDLQRQVPSPDTSYARFWVHQNKLIEGIDDSRFKVVAFYDSLTNGRAIVQQIGRVLRNPGRPSDDMSALVVSRGDPNIHSTWLNYRLFDRQKDADSLATMPKLLEAILNAQTFYYEGNFRSPVDLFKPRAWEDFAFPLSTRVYKTRGFTPDLDELYDHVLREHEMKDRNVYITEAPDDRTRIMAVVRPENSPYLRSATFIEPRFGYTIFRVQDDFLFYYDTAGGTPDIIKKHFRPLRPPELQVLFPKGAAQLTSVALLNTDIGRQAPRSRRFRASAIADLAPDLADYGYVCTIAEGHTEIRGSQFRRYLGISRSRVNDFQPGDRDFESYRQWLDALHNELTTAAKPSDVFARYATYVEAPGDKDPVHILLDIDPSDFHRRPPGSTETAIPLELDDRAAAVGGDGEFFIVANGVEHEASVAWDDERERYQLRIPTLQSERFGTVEGEPAELVRLINREQLMRIVVRGCDTIYAHGSFYRPIIPATRTDSFQLLDILYDVDELVTAKSEKGTAIVNDDWHPESVFGLISALAPASARTAPEKMAAIVTSPEMILCTDLGIEAADFVITEAHRIALVHAKASTKTHHCSASALHDVASQAIKNLQYLQPLAVAPMDRSRWMRKWSAEPHVTGTTYRLRHGGFSSSDQMWKHIRTRIQAPDTDREVWLVIGNALSKRHLERQARKAKPAPEAIQVISLLQTTWSSVSQLGARLRIFCSP